jgi:hypothetical protein
MGRRRGLGVGDRPNGRRAGIRRGVLALVRNQASTCLPPPVPRGDRQITRCPPQPGSHRVRAPKVDGPAIRYSHPAQAHPASGDGEDEGPRGRRTPHTLRLHEAREGAGRLSPSAPAAGNVRLPRIQPFPGEGRGQPLGLWPALRFYIGVGPGPRLRGGTACIAMSATTPSPFPSSRRRPGPRRAAFDDPAPSALVVAAPGLFAPRL